MKRFAAILGSALMGLMLTTGANAANPETITAEVTFANPITITVPVALKFGILDHNLATETIIIAPDDGVSGTGTGFVIGGIQAAASMTIGADTSQTLTFFVDSIVNGTGYALSAFVCNYNGGADTACNSLTQASATTATLLIGATLTGDNLAVPGVANGSFDITVAYQ
jgi:hypothetical protein